MLNGAKCNGKLVEKDYSFVMYIWLIHYSGMPDRRTIVQSVVFSVSHPCSCIENNAGNNFSTYKPANINGEVKARLAR